MSRAPGSPATLIRVYRGAQKADASAAFPRDSQDLAREGYYPVSESWAEQWGGGARLVALLLMMIVHPVVTLTVTFALRDTGTGELGDDAHY